MFETMYTDMGNIFRMLSIFWMIIGVTITVVATFGILAALKENEILANLVTNCDVINQTFIILTVLNTHLTSQYAISMTFVFLGVIGAGIADFTMISRSRFIVSDLLKSMISNYDRDFGYNYHTKMDWIQTKVCCVFIRVIVRGKWWVNITEFAVYRLEITQNLLKFSD